MKNFRPGGGRDNRGPSRGGKGGGKFGGRPSFGRTGGPGGNRGRAGGPPELFDATCSRCGKPTLVPFRPNGKKPFFCRDCFSRENHEHSRGDERGDFSPRKFENERTERPNDRPFDRHRGSREDRPRPSHPEPHRDVSTKRETQDLQIHALQKDLREITMKLDQLLVLSRGADVRASLAEIPTDQSPKIAKTSKTKKAIKK